MRFCLQLIILEAFLVNCSAFSFASLARCFAGNYSISAINGMERKRVKKTKKNSVIEGLSFQHILHLKKKRRFAVRKIEKLCFQEVSSEHNNYHHTLLFSGGLKIARNFLSKVKFYSNFFHVTFWRVWRHWKSLVAWFAFSSFQIFLLKQADSVSVTFQYIFLDFWLVTLVFELEVVFRKTKSCFAPCVDNFWYWFLFWSATRHVFVTSFMLNDV